MDFCAWEKGTAFMLRFSDMFCDARCYFFEKFVSLSLCISLAYVFFIAFLYCQLVLNILT